MHRRPQRLKLSPASFFATSMSGLLPLAISPVWLTIPVTGYPG
jgi:hypothetical protein